MPAKAFRLQHMIARFDAEAGDRALTDRLLQKIDMHRDAIDDADDRVRGAEPRFLEEACAALQDPYFAARAGLHLKDGNSLNSYIAKHSKNLRKAVENSSRYYVIFDPAFRYDLNVFGNAASFQLDCLDPEFAVFHRHMEFLMFTAMGRARVLTGRNLTPLEVRFKHKAAFSTRPMEALAGCPVHFGSEQTEMILPVESLKTPIPTFDPDLRTYLMSYGDTVLNTMKPKTPTLSQQVKAIVADQLPGKLASAHDVAAALGMSRRTFTRRLEAEALTFRGLVDDLRCTMAKAYLSEGYGLAETAFLLGYGDQAAFSTAFKRWTGASPGAWRSRA